MKKKIVLQVIGNLKVGGAETVAMNYFRNIDREKFEFHYLVYEKEIGEYEKEVYELGGKVIRLEYSKKKMFLFLINLVKLMKKNEYDIVHSHTLFNNGVVLLASKIAKIPIRISHSHSIRNKVNDTIYSQIYEKIMRKLIIWTSTDYFACSTDAGNFLYGKEFYKKHGTFIPNGIEVSRFEFDNEIRQSIRKEMEIDHKIVLGHVGHLASVKNQSYLIDLLSELNSDDFMLILLGEGSDREKLKKHAAKRGVENQVMLLGNISNVNDYLSVFDMFLFPSLFEGLPLSVIEAQANGLPCIISDKIPKDVIITDIVKSLPISSNSLINWKTSVQSTKRPSHPEIYNRMILEKKFDVKSVGTLIQKLYTKNNL